MKNERGSCRPPLLALTLLTQFLTGPRGRAEDEVAYKFELYQEDGNRINIQTHSVLFEKAFNANLTLTGEYVFDGISGASPTGAPPPAGSHQVPVAKLDDQRNAGNLVAALHFGNQTLSPQFAYSTEHDYTSIGIALNDAIEFNQKNTILNVGVSHDFDEIHPEFWSGQKHKDSTDALIGITQLLDPRTYITVNVSAGYSDGYLADPYKRFRFDDYPDPSATFAEKRPGHKLKEMLYVGGAHYFELLHAGLDGYYRLYHDSYGITAHTVGLAWRQKIGHHVILEPMVRYYYQTAADFYADRLPGDPSDPGFSVPIPDYYSADYRLSEMETLTYGAKVIYQINDHLRLDAAFKRYDMRGLDGKTSQSAYPKANVFTVGASWSF